MTTMASTPVATPTSTPSSPTASQTITEESSPCMQVPYRLGAKANIADSTTPQQEHCHSAAKHKKRGSCTMDMAAAPTHTASPPSTSWRDLRNDTLAKKLF
eukprot:m.7254 g.7254  ORF g.7254 m.7254 type:complete len:101 (-) comp3675_c0_seq1:1887-2189(-)